MIELIKKVLSHLVHKKAHSHEAIRFANDFYYNFKD